MKTISTYLAFTLLFFILSPVVGQDTVRVPLDYPTIQMALDSVKANTWILVAPGTYYENLKWTRNISGLKLVGEKGRDSTILDGGSLNRVIYKQTTLSDAGSLIQGFTIRNGKAKLNFDDGGGINSRGPVNLRDLKVINNVAEGYSYGGGINLDFYYGTIENCIVTNNTSKSSLQSLGGGMYLSADGPVTILNSTFNSNEVKGETSSYGGGVYIQNIGDPNDTIVIRHCSFNYNRTTDNIHTQAGGMYLSGKSIIIDSCSIVGNTTLGATNAAGGGIVANAQFLLVKNSWISGNSAKNGGAVYFNRSNSATSSHFINCHFDSNGALYAGGALEAVQKSTTLNFTNCIIQNNDGSAIRIANDESPKCKLTLNHCTLGNNDRGLELNNTDLIVTNSVLWNYSLDQFTGAHTESIRSTLIKGGFPGGGNFDSDPLFASSWVMLPDYGSPCFSAGNPAFATPTDIYGTARPLPLNSFPDVGAWEVNQSITYVHVKFYHDQNENGTRDLEERFIRLGAVKIQHDKSYTNFRNEGMTLSVDPGPLTVSYNDTLFTNWKVTSSPLYTAMVDSVAFSDTIEFGMNLRSADPDLKAYIISDPFRCNNHVNMNITIINERSLVESDTLWLELDERVGNYTFVNQPDIIVNSHLIGWFLDQLYPGESITLEGSVKAPSIGGSSGVGDVFLFKTWINGSIDSTLFTHSAVLLCSYDPNDKLVNPSRSDDLSLISAPLLYTVRFQNTGNDYAQHISILDTLDASLDVSTFNFIHTSHPDQLQVIFEEENVVRFYFKNIFLPASVTDLLGSNGHVSFSIQAKTDIVPGTAVENNADIYFDSNPLIVTNTTKNYMVDKFPGTKEFLIEGRQWIYEHNIYDDLPDPLVGQTIETITVGKDTLINGLVYTNVNATMHAPCGTFGRKEILREEGSKIYRLSQEYGYESLMLDFEETESYQMLFENLEGETDTAEAIIDSFGVEFLFDGTPVDVQYMRIHNNQSFDDDEPYKVYRNIGFVQYGILFPNLGNGLCDIMESIHLRCYVSGIDTLHFTSLDCYESTLTIATHDIPFIDINLSPNPATDMIIIPEGYNVFAANNAEGKSMPLQLMGNEIDVRKWPAGMYVLRFFDEKSKAIRVGKVIKL